MVVWQRIDSGLYIAHTEDWYLDVRVEYGHPGIWKWSANYRPRAMHFEGRAETVSEAKEICEQHLGEGL